MANLRVKNVPFEFFWCILNLFSDIVIAYFGFPHDGIS